MCPGDCYLEYDRVTGRYVDPKQPAVSRDVLDVFTFQQQPIPNAPLQPAVAASGQLDQTRHHHGTAAMHMDAGEVEWVDTDPSPDGEVRQYVNGRLT